MGFGGREGADATENVEENASEKKERRFRALAKKNLPKKKEEDEHPFSYARSFHGVLHEMESLAGQHEVVAEQFKRELLPVVLGVCTDLKSQRKSHLTDLQQLHQRLNGAIENMFKCQKNYGKMFKEAEAASLKYDKAEKNMDLSRAELERAKHNAHQRLQQCDDAKQTYAHSLQATNDLQHQHYTVDLPSVLEVRLNGCTSDRLEVISILLFVAEIAHYGRDASEPDQKSDGGEHQGGNGLAAYYSAVGWRLFPLLAPSLTILI